MLPIRKRTIMAICIFGQVLFFFLMTAGIKPKAIGFSKRICRFVLVAGCCEKSMTNSTQPANPCISSNTTSYHVDLFFRFQSKRLMPTVMTVSVSVNLRSVEIIEKILRQELLLLHICLQISLDAKKHIIAECSPRVIPGAETHHFPI